MSGNTGLRRFVGSQTTADEGPAISEPAAATAPGNAVPTSPLTAPEFPGAPSETEKCELCATAIPAVHSHVADLEHSSLMCACRACYLLFTHGQAARGRYRAIPDRYLTDPAHPLSVGDWDALEIPVGLAFFLNDSRRGHVTGFYPSPAGATECELDLQSWAELAAGHPLLSAPAPDVEAVLISRSESAVEYFVVPIDVCYELAGRMRLYWRGFDGGEQARASITAFLADVRSRARDFNREA
jgi:hypothetical protein